MLASSAGLARAEVISTIYVGTLSNPLSAFGANAANNPGDVARGNKYVIKTSYDTAALVTVDASTRSEQTRDFQSIALGDAPGGSNTFELFLPSEGFNSVLTQTGQDHFQIDSGYAATAEIHFFNACSSAATCAAEFRGFEFESNFVRANSPTTPAVGGDIVFEMRDPDANYSGNTVTNNVVNVLDGGLTTLMANAGTTDVRSESPGPSGGVQKPGVFLSEAVAVVAEAGATPLAYSAGTLSVTTDGGTEQVTDTSAPIVAGQLRGGPSAFDNPLRQADNDLGAGRSDKEDFLSYEWTVNGGALAGDQDGTRINRKVETLSPGGSSFVNDGTRTVANVNVIVSLAQSGLRNTTDTTSFSVQATEAFTGLSDSDSVAVSYQNTGPAAQAGDDIVFNASNFNGTVGTANSSASDADLVANAQVAGFETITANFKIGATDIGPDDVIGGATSTVSNPLSRSISLAESGITMTTETGSLDLTVTDFAGDVATNAATIRYDNALPQIANLSQTAVGQAVQFDLLNTDADLIVNTMIAEFEQLMVEILIDGFDQTSFFSALIGSGTGGSQLVSYADLTGTLGLGVGDHTLKINLRDKAMALAPLTPVMDDVLFTVLRQGPNPGVPTPATLLLLLLGLTLLALSRRSAGAVLSPSIQLTTKPGRKSHV
jgi:hypothetical protein